MGNEDKDSGSHVVSETIVEKRLDYDTESQTGAVPPEGTLKRQLKNRHIAMIRYVPSRRLLSYRKLITCLSALQYRW